MKILLARFSSMGDVVLATAAARYLKSRHKDIRTGFLTKAAFAPLLEGQEGIDEVMALQPGEGLGSLLSRVKFGAYDAILDLHGNLRSRALCLGSGLPVSRVRNHVLNRRLRVWMPWLPVLEPPQVVERGVAAAARLLGEAPPAKAPDPRLRPSKQGLKWAARFRGRMLAVAPGAAHATKEWGAEKFAAFIRGLPKGSKAVLVGGSGDRELCKKVAALAPKSKPQVLAGKTSLVQLAALLSRCSGFIGNDSGPTHLAAALGVPVLALFGPTVHSFGFFPRGNSRVLESGEACRPCHVHGLEACPLGTHACMETIGAARALDAWKELSAKA